MNRAVAFWVDILGLKLLNPYGDHWAEVRAGTRLTLGLHPRSEKGPRPGTSGNDLYLCQILRSG